MEKTLKSNLMFDGKVVKVYKDDVLCENGNTSVREIIRHNGGVCILGIVDDKVILEKQYRYAYNEEIYELPAGKLEINENPYDAGLREFEEETGYKAESLIDLGCMYPTCGYSSEIIYLYLANNISKSKRHLDEDEVIDIMMVSIDEVLKMIDENKIKDAKTICLIHKYLRYINKKIL